MQTALRILTHTPAWAFILLAYLIWQGLQALRPRTQAVWRLLIVPLVFFGMGLSRLVFGARPRLGAAAGMVRGVQRGLLFRLGDLAVAGLPEFRWRAKYRKLKSLLAH